MNKLNHINVNYLKIPEKHHGPHKMPLWATCEPLVWDHWFKTRKI